MSRFLHTRRYGSESGFTLVELMVAMPLMLLVMGGLTIMLTTLNHWGSHTQEETTLQSEARASLNQLEYNIRGAFVGDGRPRSSLRRPRR